MGRKILLPQKIVKHLRPYNQKELKVDVDRNGDTQQAHCGTIMTCETIMTERGVFPKMF